MNNNHQSTNQRNQAEHIAVDTNLPQLGQCMRGGGGSDGDDDDGDQQDGGDSRKRERDDSPGRDPQDCQDEDDKCDSVSRAVFDHMRKQSKYRPPESWEEIRDHMGEYTGPVPSLSYVGKKVDEWESTPWTAEVVVRKAKQGRWTMSALNKTMEVLPPWTMSGDHKRIGVLPPQLKKRRIADNSGVTKVTEQVNNCRINMVELGTDDDATDTKIDCNEAKV